MRRLISGAGLDLKDCFFTNACPCMHNSTSSTLGELISEWLINSNLMRDCTRFFLETCAALQPSMIVTLGPGPAAFLAAVWRRDLKPWSRNTIEGIDSLPFGSVQIESLPYRTVCASVVHPCYQHCNAKHRKVPYRHAEGEVLLIKEADGERKVLLRSY